MASRNGLGPNNQGPLTGRGMGACGTVNNVGKIGLGIGAGLGMVWGCRNGFNKRRNVNSRGMRRGIGVNGFQTASGFGQTNPLCDEESLVDYSERLKRELAEVEKQIVNSKED